MQKMTHAERGSLGGRLVAERMTPEQRSARGRAGALAGIAARVENSWDDLTEEARERIRAVANR